MFSPGSQEFWRPLPGCCAPFLSAAWLRQPEILAASPLVRRAFSLRGERLERPEVCVRSPRVRRAFSLCGERPGQPEAWRPPHWCAEPFPSAASGPGGQKLGALSTGSPRLFPPQPQRTPPVGSQEVFRQEPGPVCSVGGGGFSGAEFAPFPLPAASYLQRGWSGSSLEFLSPFVLQTAGGVFRPVNFSSLSPTLKKAPSSCSQGLLAGPYPKECRRLLSVPPPLAGGGCGRLGYFSAGSCF